MSNPNSKSKKKPYIPPVAVVEDKLETAVVEETPNTDPVAEPPPEVTPDPAPSPAVAMEPVQPKVAKMTPKDPNVANKDLMAKAQDKYGKSRGDVHWDKDVSKKYLEDGLLPEKTPRDNWVSDTTRIRRLNQLTETEYLDFVEGHFDSELEELEVELFWKAVYERFRLPGNLTYRAAKAKLLKGTDPEMTANGLLVQCSVRDTLPLSNWTYLEVRAALLNEISRGQHTEDQLVDRLKEILQLPKDTSTELVTRNLEEAVKSTMYDQLMEAKLEEYKNVRIGPNRKGPAEIGTAHALFLRQVRQLIAKEYPVFKEGWNILLGFVKREENTLFSDKTRYVHWDNVPLQGNDLEALESLLTLLKMSVENSNVGRALAPSLVVDLTRLLGPQEDVEKIVAYYSR